MKHRHSEILKAYAEDTSVKIERKSPYTSKWCAADISQLFDYSDDEFRIKLAMCSITLQDGTVVEWPEPMRVAPAEGTEVWYINGSGVVRASFYSTSTFFHAAIHAGFCHLTKEAAQQHRKAIVLANGGEL